MAQLGNHVFEYTRNGKRRLAGKLVARPTLLANFAGRQGDKSAGCLLEALPCSHRDFSLRIGDWSLVSCYVGLEAHDDVFLP